MDCAALAAKVATAAEPCQESKTVADVKRGPGYIWLANYIWGKFTGEGP
jgi:hypothetical protein